MPEPEESLYEQRMLETVTTLMTSSGPLWLTEAGIYEPELYRIQEPEDHFREGKNFDTGFIIQEGEWRIAQNK